MGRETPTLNGVDEKILQAHQEGKMLWGLCLRTKSVTTWVLKDFYFSRVVVAHSVNLSTWETGCHVSEFEASLVYRVNSRTVRTVTQRTLSQKGGAYFSFSS